MGPFVDGVSDEIRHAFRVFLELFPWGFVPRDIRFVHAHLAQEAPFIMVSPEPYFRDGFEAMVFVDLLGNQVAMEIENRHLGGVILIEPLRQRAIQQEIIAKELFHIYEPRYSTITIPRKRGNDE